MIVSIFFPRADCMIMNHEFSINWIQACQRDKPGFNPFPSPGYCLVRDRRDADAATRRGLVEGSASLPKWHDAVRPSGGGGHGRGLLLRDLTRAAAGWMCSAQLILQRGADQPAQPSDIGT